MTEYVELVKAFSPWITGLAALIGVLIGGFINFITVRWSEKNKAIKQKESLHLALVAEVHSLISLILARDFQGVLNNLWVELKTENNKDAKRKYCIKVSSQYRTIFDANANKIGLLDKVDALFIVGFHQLITSIIQDITEGGALANGGDAIDFAETLSLLDGAVKLGKIIEMRANLPDGFKR